MQDEVDTEGRLGGAKSPGVLILLEAFRRIS
jgi:hypothetical protein